MARLVTCGFELGGESNPTNASLYTTGAPSPDGFAPVGGASVTNSINSRSGNYCYNHVFNSDAGNVVRFMPTMPALGQTVYCRFYLNVVTLLAAGDAIFLFSLNSIGTATSAAIAGSQGVILELSNSAGSTSIYRPSLSCSDGTTQQALGITPVLNTNTWYRIEISLSIGTGAVDSVNALVDGVSFVSATGLSIADIWPSSVDVGAWAEFGTPSVGNIYIDDVAVNDSTGTSQNTWPGSGKIVLLKPISDSAKGTGWTNDNASTTNLFDNVNNTPPVGIADTTSGGGGHQIRNATSNANSNYDAMIATYSSAGIGSLDTITVIDPIIATSAPVATSAKQGTVGVTTNPAITNISLGAAGSSGAFWGGIAAGFYQTGWKWSHGTIQYLNSLVNKSTSPVMRVTQVTSSTRVAMVCFMGIYVEYVPAVVAGSLVTEHPHRRLHHRRNKILDRW